MKTMARFLIFLVVFCQAACKPDPPGYQCPDPLGCVSLAPGEPVRIVALQSLSGDTKSLGTDNIRGAEMAVDAWKNQILGHPLKLGRMDDLCSKAGGKTAAEKIVSDPRVVAVFGTTCSGAAVPAARIISAAGLSMVSGANTAPTLTSVNGHRGPDNYPGYLRTAVNDEFLGRAAADFAFGRLGKKKAATIHDGDPYTKGLAVAFEHSFDQLGGKIVVSVSVNKGDRNMRPVLTEVAQSEAELIFFPIFEPEGDLVVKQVRAMPDFDDVGLVSADALMTSSFVESAGEAGKGVYFIVARAKPESGAYDEFVVRYKNKYGQSPMSSQHAQAFDAVDILLKAIAETARQDGNGYLHIGRQALRDALYATSGHEGLTGTITCDTFGDCGDPKFKVVRLDDPAAGIEALSGNVIYTYKPPRQSDALK